jgi:hypothetical protein
MLNFTTTTVINSLEDVTSGKPLIEKDGGVIRIKRHNPFVESKIVSVVRTNHVAPKCASVTVASLAEYGSDRRIELYVRSVGNADPMFANSLLHKGKPLFIEIPAYTTAEDLDKIVNKYNNLMFGGDNQIHSEVDGSGNLILTCANPYQTITKAVLAARDAESGEFVDSKVLTVYDAINNPTGEIVRNEEGFGDYDHIMKDLRLPTAANLRWKRTMEDEMPIKGASYDQFILTYRVDRGVMGLGVVGATATSETTHVFWVNSEVADDFANKFATLETRGE